MDAGIAECSDPDCAGRIVKLHADYYAAASGFGAEFEAKVARELAAFLAAYRPDRDLLLLARADASIEGSIAIDGTRAGEEGAHLRWFIASDRIRGQGIGRQMLARALQFADDRGYPLTYLWTFAGLDAARRLYESFGFRLVREGPGVQWGREVREQRFERRKLEGGCR
jgi:GNAT superfamily N-acetyltransferase